MQRDIRTILLAAALPATLICAPSPVWAGPSLGNASPFAVLAGASVTSAGTSVITGNVGVSPGTAVTGFYPSGIVAGGGAIHVNDGIAAMAENDFLLAYAVLGASIVTRDLTGGALGVGALGSLTAGVYRFDTTARLNGTITLDGGGDPNATFIFLIGTALTTASGSSVLLTNGAFFDNVYFLTGTAATLGVGTAFNGSLLAGSSITLDSGASIACGRAFAQASVTLIGNRISTDCRQSRPEDGSTDVPEPNAMILLTLGLAGLAARRRHSTPRKG